MKNVVNAVFAVLIIGGLMAMAGSAGDCDGKCMEQANTIGEMITISLIGLACVIVGAYGAYKVNAD